MTRLKYFFNLNTILTGIFVGTSFIPFYPWAAAFAWIPLWFFWLKDASPNRVIISGWMAQFVFTLIGFHWISHVAQEFGHLPWWIAQLTLLGFAAISNLQVPLSGWIWSYLHRNYIFSKQQSLVVLALTLVVLEYFFPMIFPWNMGYAWLYSKWPAYNWADVFGFQGLSALTILLNLAIASMILRHQEGKRITFMAGATVATLIFLNVTGYYRNQEWNEFDRKLSVLQVQANIGNFEKIAAEKKGLFKDAILDKYIKVTKDGLVQNPNVDLVIWPETAIPEQLDDDFKWQPYAMSVRNRIQQLGKTVITGAYSQDLGDPRIYNAMFLLNSDGTLASRAYRKNILLAFGEYFPGSEWFPYLKQLIPEISDFGRGQGATIFMYKDLALGPQICYEGLFPFHSKELLSQGAHLLMNITNDSWYDEFSEPLQHLYMTLGRAIEYRRPLIRTTNTGISTAILANGKILEFTPINKEATQALDIELKFQPKHTFFERNGKYYPYLFLLMLIALVVKFILERHPAKL